MSNYTFSRTSYAKESGPSISFMLASVTLFCLVVGCDSASEPGVKVIKYAGPPITEQMSDGNWIAHVEFGAATLQKLPRDLDAGEIEYELSLIDAGSGLPAFGGWSSPSGADSTRWTMYDGTVAIESFDLEGKISGRVDGRLRKPGTIAGPRVGTYFYAMLTESSKTQTRVDTLDSRLEDL